MFKCSSKIYVQVNYTYKYIKHIYYLLYNYLFVKDSKIFDTSLKPNKAVEHY